MKYLFLSLCVLITFSTEAFAQNKEVPEGRVIFERFTSEAILNNPGGEDAMRRVTVYLPPGYDESVKRYPVIYFLHGFTWSDSLHIAVDQMNKHLDQAIADKLIRETIVVMPNNYTNYMGSHYTNSPLTGNWIDFTANEVVQFVDKNYRTIADRNSRGLAGQSMGGHGALKIGMLKSDVFGAVYALSPGTLGWGNDLSLTNPAFKAAQMASTREELFENFYATAIVAMCRAYSPNAEKEPFQCDLPVHYEGDQMHVKPDVLAKWNRNMATNMIADHVEELESLNAIMLDWGRNDGFTHILPTARAFSEEL